MTSSGRRTLRCASHCLMSRAFSHRTSAPGIRGNTSSGAVAQPVHEGRNDGIFLNCCVDSPIRHFSSLSTTPRTVSRSRSRARHAITTPHAPARRSDAAMPACVSPSTCEPQQRSFTRLELREDSDDIEIAPPNPIPQAPRSRASRTRRRHRSATRLPAMRNTPPQPFVVRCLDLRLKQPQERLLHDIVGVGSVVRHAVDVCPYRPLMPLVELAKGVFREHCKFRGVLLRSVASAAIEAEPARKEKRDDRGYQHRHAYRDEQQNAQEERRRLGLRMRNAEEAGVKRKHEEHADNQKHDPRAHGREAAQLWTKLGRRQL